jgi:hypothetical protein
METLLSSVVSWYLLEIESWSGLGCGSEGVLAPPDTFLSRNRPPCRITINRQSADVGEF